MYKKEVMAMLLAGGQGSRLGRLTRNIPKPALSFGAKYRIIDFSLSNCVNSNIDTVGVLTQYKPFLLNSYIGTGLAWDLDNSCGGVHILPPFVGESGGSWYKGTANAIYQNIDFINFYNPDYVLIISGDHVYKMNYEAMLTYHKKQNADVTISVLEVSSEEVSRFGIVTADKQGRIFKFTEKPKESDSNLASMGIYIFNWPVLKRALLEDEENPDSNNDFGQNVLPMLLNEEKRLFAYGFQGYWKDVGTVESYYDTNMELLKEKPSFDIFDSDIKIFSNEKTLPPQYIGPKAQVNNCLIGNGCTILGEVKNSIVSSGVYVGERCRVEDSILLPSSKIMNDSRVYKAIIGEHTNIAAFSFISSIKRGVNTRQAEITVIERSRIIAEDFQALA